MSNQFIRPLSHSSSAYIPITPDEEYEFFESYVPHELPNMTTIWRRSISMLNMQLKKDELEEEAPLVQNEEAPLLATSSSKSLPLMKKVKVEKGGKVSSLVKMFSRLIIKDQESATPKEIKPVKAVSVIEEEDKEDKLDEYIGVLIRRGLVPLSICHESSLKNLSCFVHPDLLKASTPLNENKIKIEKISDSNERGSLFKETKKADDSSLPFLLDQCIAWFLLKTQKLYGQIPKNKIAVSLKYFMEGCSISVLNRILSLFTACPNSYPLVFVKKLIMVPEKTGEEDTPAYMRLREMIEVLARQQLMIHAKKRSDVVRIMVEPILVFYQEPYKTAVKKFLSHPTRSPELVHFMNAVDEFEESFRPIQVRLQVSQDEDRIHVDMSERKKKSGKTREELAFAVISYLQGLNISEKKARALAIQVTQGNCYSGMFSKVLGEVQVLSYMNFIEESSKNSFWYSSEFISMCLEYNIPCFIYKKVPFVDAKKSAM